MPEYLLHYIWQQGLFLAYPQTTTDGRPVEVLSTGRHNHDAGPDFTDVHLRIDEVDLYGQIEIHVASSDWHRHHHDTDPAYDHILLHVVRKADKEVYNSQGEPLPQLELQYDEKDYVGHLMHDAMLMDSAWSTHRCAQSILTDPSLITMGWKQTLLERRLQCKTESIERLLTVSHNDWNTAFYVSLAHACGFHINGVPMEMLALATPLSVLYKHRSSLEQLSSLLLGQAGLLDPNDPRYREYTFLRTKFGLTPINPALWKHSRMRPVSHPAVRVQQLAIIIHDTEFLFSQCMETKDADTLRSFFQSSGMGKSSIDGLIINTVAPFLYARSQKSQAINLLHALPAESNRIIRQWQTLGQTVTDAFDSQALIHLYTTCCEQGQCSSCAVWSESAVKQSLQE